MVIEVSGEKQHQTELGKFRWLKGKTANPDPAVSAQADLADQQDEKEHDQGETKDDIGETGQGAIAHQAGREHGDDAETHPGDLTQVEGTAKCGDGQGVGAVYRENAQERHTEDRGNEPPVKIGN